MYSLSDMYKRNGINRDTIYGPYTDVLYKDYCTLDNYVFVNLITSTCDMRWSGQGMVLLVRVFSDISVAFFVF